VNNRQFKFEKALFVARPNDIIKDGVIILDKAP
jgi:hypothetical protein